MMMLMTMLMMMLIMINLINVDNGVGLYVHDKLGDEVDDVGKADVNDVDDSADDM